MKRIRFRWWMIPSGLVLLVVVIVAVAAIILATKDVSAFKTILIDQVRSSTGRELAIDGAFDLKIGLSPSIVAEDVSLSNAPSGTRPAMIKAKKLTTEIALFPMLSGRIEAKRLVIEGADVLLETDTKGVPNWRFEKPADTMAAPAAKAEREGTGDKGKREVEAAAVKPPSEGTKLSIADLRVVNSMFGYRDGQTGTLRSIFIEQALGKIEGDDGTLHLKAKGALDNTPLEAEIMIGGARINAPLDATLTMSGARISIKGVVGDPTRFAGLDLAVEAAADSTKSLAALLGWSAPPDLKPLKTAFRLTGGGDRYKMEKLDATLGGAHLSGLLALALGPPRPRIDGDLAADQLDLTRFTAAENVPGKDAGTAENGGEGTAKSAGKAQTDPGAKGGGAPLFSTEPLKLDVLRSFDAKLALRAKSVIYQENKLSDVSLTLVVDEGRLTLAPLQGKLAEGAFDGTLMLDARGKSPTMTVQAKVKGASLQEILQAAKVKEKAEGKVDLAADLKGAGTSPHAIASSLGGGVALVMGKARIDNAYIDLLAADLVSTLMPWNKEEKTTNVNCFVVRFGFDKGVGRSEALLFDTSKMTMGGEGSIDLGAEQIDLRLVPKPKDAALLSLAVPVVIKGPLGNPSAGPDEKALALGVAGAALGTLINPLGILIPLVSAGDDNGNACVDALAHPKKNEKAGGGNAKKSAEEPGDPVSKVFKGLGDIFK